MNDCSAVELIELALRRVAAEAQDNRIDVRLVRVADEIAKLLRERHNDDRE